MDDKRKLEIAMALLKRTWLKQGVMINQNSARELGNLSKETGISAEELKAFLKPLALELVEKTFA